MAWLRYRIHIKDRGWRKLFLEMSRPAGWSLQQKNEELEEKLISSIFMLLMGGLFFWAVSMSQPHPASLTISGFLVSAYFGCRCRCLVLKRISYRHGLLGEQMVGQILDRLSSQTLRVFHDLVIKEPGKKPWNIDHVVVTPAGVFSIETKYRQKPSSDPDGHRVTFDGSQLIFPAPLKNDYSSVDQTRRNAEWLSQYLTRLNGCAVEVRGALVLPGWWVEQKGRGHVAVMNPKSLAGFFSRRNLVIPQERFSAICAQLEERCRIPA